MRRRVWTAAVPLTALLLVAPVLPAAAQPAADGSFPDVPSSDTHAPTITIAAQVGIAAGRADGSFGHTQTVPRDQIATFLQRGLRLGLQTYGGTFADVPRSNVHARAIEALHREGITAGCRTGPLRFCPAAGLTRAQMATLLAEAFALPSAPRSSFGDVDRGTNPHAEAIDRLVAAEITSGCSRPGSFCPNDTVTRGQMATFLVRALELNDPEFGGPTPCPTRTDPLPASPAARGTERGPAVPPTQYGTSGAIRTSRGLEVFSMGISPQRSARLDDAAALSGTATLRLGSRTWASTRVGDTTYLGQWGAGQDNVNVLALPAAGSGDRTTTDVASVPLFAEFWSLTADDTGVLYAGTDAHKRLDDLEDDEQILHRVDPTSGQVEELRFEVPALPRDPLTGEVMRDEDGRILRGDVKQVAWHDDVLFVGTGQVTGASRLYALTGLDGDVEVEDVTPDAMLPGPGPDDRGARGVFSLAVDDDVIAIGTHAGGTTDARIITLDRDDPQRVLADVAVADHSRIDSVAIGDGQVIGAAFPSGAVHAVTLPDLDTPAPLPPATVTRSTVLGTPVPDTATRFVEVRDGRVGGVAATGVVWRLATDGTTERHVQIAGLPGSPAGAGEAHSLAAVPGGEVAVGTNNAVWLRRPGATTARPVPVAGEAKAMTALGRDVYAASYPAGELWRVDTRTDRGQLVADWDNRWNRPAAVAVDGDRQRAYVLSRDDEVSRELADGRPTTYAGALIAVDLRTGETLHEHPLTDGVPTAERPDGRYVHGTALAVDADSGDVVVGDADGRVQRVDLDGAAPEVVWRYPTDEPSGRRAASLIRSVDVEGDHVAITTASSAVMGGPTQLRLDLDDGEMTWASAAGRSSGEIRGASALFGPVQVVTKARSLVAIDRGRHHTTTVASFATPGTWLNWPLFAAGDGCALHVVSRRQLVEVPYDARTRLDR